MTESTWRHRVTAHSSESSIVTAGLPVHTGSRGDTFTHHHHRGLDPGTSFRADQIAALPASGWAQCRSVADAVAASTLPAVTAGYLQEAFTTQHWHAAETVVFALRDQFSAARFAEGVTWGIVLAPDPDRLDTRGRMEPTVRRDQLGVATADVVDPRQGAGRLGVEPGGRWWPPSPAPIGPRSAVTPKSPARCRQVHRRRRRRPRADHQAGVGCAGTAERCPPSRL